MARHIHLDAVGGVAGDMFVAALLDALPDLRARVFADLAAVTPPHVGAPALTAGLSGGLAVLRFGLAPAATAGGEDAEGGAHDHGTRYVDLVRTIDAAQLQPGTATHARAILARVADAESRLHGVALDEVHFHELADWDSLLDVVAAGSIAAALSDCSWSVSDLPLGGGQVMTRHGWLPVPAPATAAILRSYRWRGDGIGGERVTPTGAAIVAHLARAEAAAGGGTLAAIGLGAGTRELAGMPNVLRALVFEIDDAAPAYGRRETVTVVCFDVDDMTGEEIGTAADRLRAVDGVLDLTLGTRHGKKGRPSADFRLLVRPAALDAVRRACFTETSTIGLRWHGEERICLDRASETLDAGPAVAGATPLARKRSVRPDGAVVTKVESDALAGTAGLAERRRLKAHAEEAEAGQGAAATSTTNEGKA